MALKTLMLRKKIDDAKKALEVLRAKDAEFESREAEIKSAIDEAQTDEERSAVEEAVDKFDAERAEHDNAKGELERSIEELEANLADAEAEQIVEPVQGDAAPVKERGEKKAMANRMDFFGMSIQERDAFIGREDVQNFLAEVRTAMKEKRAITNAGLLIPKVVLGLLRENIQGYSKMYKHVNVRRVPGEGRMIVEGAIPEAVWTEMCANLNELDLAFSQVEVDGYKVGGYFRICNATLEDSDIDLAAELISVLGQAIGYALDKAILYGTGTKMPTGVMTGIKSGNIVSIAASKTGVALFQEIIRNFGLAQGKYSRGEKCWAMNEKTYTELIAQAMSINVAGAIVSGVNATMPVIGGAIEILNFIPDNTVIGGYFDLYLLAERAGTRISTSEHAFWVEDQTGFKGTARYDGKVLANDAFVAIGIQGATPAAGDVTFAADTANAGA